MKEAFVCTCAASCTQKSPNPSNLISELRNRLQRLRYRPSPRINPHVSLFLSLLFSLLYIYFLLHLLCSITFRINHGKRKSGLDWPGQHWPSKYNYPSLQTKTRDRQAYTNDNRACAKTSPRKAPKVPLSWSITAQYPKRRHSHRASPKVKPLLHRRCQKRYETPP